MRLRSVPRAAIVAGRKVRAASRSLRRPGSPAPTPDYEELYEAHAQSFDDDRAIGDGEFDLIGRVELAIVRHVGLEPDSVLLDMGCGTGRLAIHAVPYLDRGVYIGTDISKTMLARAQARLEGYDTRRYRLIHQPHDQFPLPERSIDIAAAYSVFTHIEPEDMYRCLVDALRIMRPGGAFVVSCIPVDNAAAEHVFMQQAELPFSERWQGVRNYVTSKALVEAIATWAGWQVEEWFEGSDDRWEIGSGPKRAALGQSVAVLRAS